MALKLVANISKKIPIPGLDYSSVQASCSIEGEISDLAKAPEEIRRLYRLAEDAVDIQLRIGNGSSTPVPPPALASSNASPVAPAVRPQGQASGRRAPAPISPAQSRYLNQLIERSPGALTQILTEHRVAGIDQLTSRDASAIIDRLKGAPA